MRKTLIRKRHSLEELTGRDLELLSKAFSLSEDQWLCFGKSFHRLEELGLITEENQITHFGRKHLWSLSNEVKAKAVVQ